MRRREFITFLGGAAVWPLAARAQQAAVPVVGYLAPGSPQLDANAASFRRGLSDIGFVEGQNVRIEYRYTEGYPDRLPAAATELVQHRAAAIVVIGTTAALAARAASSSIPIVFFTGSDPVKFGLVASLNRPGGNTTGVTAIAVDLEGKRLELLSQLAPAARTIGALVNPKNPNAETQTKDLQSAGRAVGRQIHILYAATEREIDVAFTTLAQEQAGALTVAGDTFFPFRRGQIVTLAAHYSIPTMYQRREFAEVGGLVSYGTNFGDMSRQAGTYAGRILKGEKPGDLPVVQPTKFELIINLTTAKALGLTVPNTLLAIVDEVIE